MNRKKLKFEQGLAYVIAELIRNYDEPTIALEILKSSGFTYKELKQAGVETYDLEIIKKELK